MKKKLAKHQVEMLLGDITERGYTTHASGDMVETVEAICQDNNIAHKVVNVRMNGFLIGKMVVTPKYFADKGMDKDPGIELVKEWQAAPKRSARSAA